MPKFQFSSASFDKTVKPEKKVYGQTISFNILLHFIIIRFVEIVSTHTSYVRLVSFEMVCVYVVCFVPFKNLAI